MALRFENPSHAFSLPFAPQIVHLAAFGPDAIKEQLSARIARNDFSVLIDSGYLPCDRFQVAYLSPLFVNALENDPTIDQFGIKNADSIFLTMLYTLILGEAIAVEEIQHGLMKLFCIGFRKAELNEQVVEFAMSGEELTLLNCISRLHHKSRFDVSIASETTFIASHFSEFAADALRHLKLLELEDVVSRENLCITNEDAFLIV
jgi:hypothetical protein